MKQLSAAFQDEVPNFVASGSKTSSLTITGARIRVAQPRSGWFVELQTRFDELTGLSCGWDGYQGRPVSFNCAQFAASLIERLFVENLPPPQLVPGGDGSVQFEWHRNQFDVEIDVLAPYDVVATRHDHLTGQSEELELQTDFSRIGEWISDLERPRQLERQVEGG